jgi:Kdo2-lipid IVA lauroyltransferase/acyltransferase
MLTLARWLAHWPLWLLHALGGALGWVVFVLSPRYRRRFREQVRAAGVSRADAQAAVASAGRLVMEIPRLWLHRTSEPTSASAAGDPLALPVSVFWSGRSSIDEARLAGRGVVLLTPHLGCFEITAQAFAATFGRDLPVTVMYRPARQAWLRDLQRVARDRPGLAAVPTTLAGVRQMIRALRRGEAVGLLPDQVPPDGMGEWAAFLGRPAYTMTLAARLVSQTDAQVLLIWGERLGRGAGYHVHVEPFGDTALLKGSPASAALAVNQAMERLIRRCPSQYLWGYDRHRAPRPVPSASDPSGAASTVLTPAPPAVDR